MGNPVNNIDEKIKIHDIAIQELRLKYQNLNTDYANLSTKMFTLMATQLVITTFIFTFKINDKKPLFTLNGLDTFIFFGIGLAAILAALGILFWAVMSKYWAEAPELKELDRLRYDTYLDFLRETKSDYVVAIKFCTERYEKLMVAFDSSVVSFIIGIVTLMVIKVGG